jgi:hypothetical protein
MKQKLFHLGVGLITFLIGFTLAGLWSEHRPLRLLSSDPVVSRSIEEDRIAEALFRYLLQEHRGLEVYFLSRDGADPTDEFMRRFQGKVPLKKKRSLSTRGQYRRIRDNETGAIAGIVSVGHVQWISDSEVEIRGGFYDGEVIEYRYRMVHANAGWIPGSTEFVMES